MLSNQAANTSDPVDTDWLNMRLALGSRIRKLRIEKSWSQQELADNAGTRQAKVSRLETGQIEPELGLVFRIARTLDTSVTDLLRNSDTAGAQRDAGAVRPKPSARAL